VEVHALPLLCFAHLLCCKRTLQASKSMPAEAQPTPQTRTPLLTLLSLPRCSNAKSLASVGSRMSTDTAFGRAHSGNVKGKRTGGTRGADGKILGVLKDRSSGGKGGSKLPAIPSEPPSPRAKSGASPMMAGIKSMFRWMGRA